MSRIERAFDNWPTWLQIAGGIAICFGVGALAGLAWGLVTIGLEAVVCGALAEN